MEEIRASFFPRSVLGGPDAAPRARYDMRTIHDAEFGGANGYVADREAVLQALSRFIGAEMAA